MRDPAFPKHFDGKRFYNPDAPQARGLLDVLRWKLTSRPETSPRFIPDVGALAAGQRASALIIGLKLGLVITYHRL